MVRLLLILLLAGCASNYDVTKVGYTGTIENPTTQGAVWYYNCAAWLMRVEAPGPVPTIRWMNERWVNYDGEIASGAYVEEINAVYVARVPIFHEIIVHEMAHALMFQLGEEDSKVRAYKVSDWWRDCLYFGEDLDRIP